MAGGIVAKIRRLLSLLLVAAPLAAAIASFPSAAVHAADFTVNDTRDAVQSAPPDGGCHSTLGSGVCTLRAAIEAANEGSAGLNGALKTVSVPAGTYALTIPPSGASDGSAGALRINGIVTMVGSGQGITVIENLSSPFDRVVYVSSGATGNILNLTITNGQTTTPGGGIENLGNLTLTSVTVTSNTTTGLGGGIDNVGSLALRTSTVSSNAASSGGGLSNSGTTVINGSLFTQNLANGANAAQGGAILNRGNNSTLNIAGSSIHANSANASGSGSAEGGGIADTGVNATIAISNSTVDGNQAASPSSYARGGGLSAPSSGTLVTITGTTFNSNTLSVSVPNTGRGGAIDASGIASIAVTNSTVTANAAVGVDAGGISSSGRSSISVNFATIDGNSAPQLENGGQSFLGASNSIIAGTASNCLGAITDQGYNLDNGNTCGFSAVNNDVLNSDPLLGPLQNNGGPTNTQALGPGSPAIDAASPTTAASPCPPPATDQRGASRPFNSRCDMGAFEFGATPPSGGGAISVLTAGGTTFNGETAIPLTVTVATFTDSQASGNASDYSATIGWGDGQTSNGTIIANNTGGSVQGTHTYILPGNFTIIVKITKIDGATATATSHAHIVTHFKVESKAWIPMAWVVDPWMPDEPTSYADARVNLASPNCLFVPPPADLVTWLVSRYIGDNHAPFSGTYRIDLTLDFDWDGTTITNQVVKKTAGTTRRVKVYWIAGQTAWCQVSGHADLKDMFAHVAGSSFAIQLKASDPLVALFSPPITMNLTGSVNPKDDLSLNYSTTAFPSLAVKTTRDGTVADTAIVNDASCLSQADVLGQQGRVNLSVGLLHNAPSGSRVVSGSGAGGSSSTGSPLCWLHLPGGGVFASPVRGGAGISGATASQNDLAAVKATSTSSKSGIGLRVARPAGPTGSSGSTDGAISGTITDTGGKPLGNICVAATNPFGSAVTTATTSSKGTYTITGLAPAPYQVRFEECGNGAHLTQWYNGQATEATAATVTVTAGATTSGIDAQLGTGGTISGLITNSSGTPLANICVHAQDSRGHFADSLATGNTGTYSVRGLPTGNYLVLFIDCPASDYLSQFYNGSSSARSATTVAVTSGANTGGINAAMVLGGIITGTVTDSSGVALSQMCAYAIDASSGGLVDTSSTNTSGAFTLDGLPAGRYVVEFADCSGGNHLAQFWHGKSSASAADVITVSNGVTTTGINAALATGGTIAGTITDASGTPISGTCADAESATGGGGRGVSSPTGSAGTYSIPALPSDTYTVKFFDCSGANHVPQWFNGQSSPATANPVSVTAGATTSGINGNLSSGGTIAGTVTAAGVAATNVCVGALDTSGNVVGTAGTNASGVYAIAGLPAGSYTMDFKDCLQGNHVEQTLGPIVVAGNSVAVNATLTLAGSITGTVTDSANHLLTDICVIAQSTTSGAQGYATTDASGGYSLANLAPDQYTVQFRGCTNANGNLATQWYGGALSSAGATAVTVSSNLTSSGINASLSAGGSISGKVTDASSAPLANACVSPVPASSAAANPLGTTTDSTGAYTLSGLPSGTYSLQFADCSGGNHLNGSGGPVTVTAPNSVTGVNVQLATGGVISGRVTDLGSGAPLTGICVDAFPTGSTNITASVVDNSDGTYSLAPLAAGTYNVEFSDCAGAGHVTQWANNKPSQSAADAIAVSPGATTAGVNAALSP